MLIWFFYRLSKRGKQYRNFSSIPSAIMASIMNSKKLSQTVQRLQAKKIYLMDQLYNSVIIILLDNQLISLIKNTQELNDAKFDVVVIL